MIAEDSVRPLGEYVQFALSKAGDVAISDLVNHRIVVYPAGGGAPRSFGVRGSGPGELDGPRTINYLDSDSTIAVIDLRNRRLSTFDAISGQFRSATGTTIGDAGANWIPRAGALWMGAWGAGRVAGVWERDRESFALVGELPEEMGRDAYTVLSHGRPELLGYGDGFLVLLPTQRHLFAMSLRGSLTPIARIPLRQRRGPTDDIFARSARQQAEKGARRFEPAGSVVAAFGRSADSSVVVVYLDGEQVVGQPRSPGAQVFGNFRLYVTLLSPDLSRACVDGEIPVETDVLPTVRVRGDSLAVFARYLDSTLTVKTRVALFRMDTTSCEWISTAQASR